MPPPTMRTSPVWGMEDAVCCMPPSYDGRSGCFQTTKRYDCLAEWVRDHKTFQSKGKCGALDKARHTHVSTGGGACFRERSWSAGDRYAEKVPAGRRPGCRRHLGHGLERLTMSEKMAKARRLTDLISDGKYAEVKSVSGQNRQPQMETS